MIPAKFIVIVLAMFAIVSSVAITPTVLTTMAQTAHAQTNNSTALPPHERRQQLVEQQQQEQRQQQPSTHAQANNTSTHAQANNTSTHAQANNTSTHAQANNSAALSSQVPQPECPEGYTPVTMNNTDMCQESVSLQPGCQEGTFNSSTGYCEQTLTFPPNQDGQCTTGTLNEATGLCEEIVEEEDYTCPTGFELVGPPPTCSGIVVVQPNCPDGYFFSPFQNECEPNQTRTQLST
jgi:hypothetical protein